MTHHVISLCLVLATTAWQDGPEALNPFDHKDKTREDAMPGYLEVSDGSVRAGMIYLTREHRLKIFDDKLERSRLVPLSAVERVDCKILKEWQEKEWRFKENANDEKVYTGHTYPAREYVHTVTLKGGRKIQGALAGIVYVETDKKKPSERFLLHKRDRGETDTDLKSLLYVRCICLGEEALKEGQARISQKKSSPDKKTPPRKRPSGRVG